MNSTERAYGADSTPEFETLAEATRRDDGTIEFRVVQMRVDPPMNRPEFGVGNE